MLIVEKYFSLVMVVEAAKLPDNVLEAVFAFLELPDLQNCSLGNAYLFLFCSRSKVC